MYGGNVKERIKTTDTRSEEIISWDSEFGENGESRGAKEVDYDGCDGAGARDLLKGSLDIRVAEAEGLENNNFHGGERVECKGNRR